MINTLRAGVDTPLFSINSRWRLAADRLQWVIQCRRGHNSEKWRSVRFIASDKRILLRDLRELGVEPTPGGWACLDALPDSFSEFRDGYPAIMARMAPASRFEVAHVRDP